MSTSSSHTDHGASEKMFCHCLYFSTNVLARQLSRLAEEVFTPTGLSPSHAFLLMLVVRQPGISQKQIGTEMELTASTITRFLDRLVQQGLVERKGTGKMSFVHPTPMGIARNTSLQEAWNALGERYRDLLGPVLAKALTDDVYRAKSMISD